MTKALGGKAHTFIVARYSWKRFLQDYPKLSLSC